MNEKDIARVIAPETVIKEDELDIKDKKIISILIKNSRTPVSRIAKILGYSKEVVNYRISKLIKENIITDFYAVIDSTKLGFEKFNIYLEFYNLSKTDEQGVINYLLNNKNVSWIISTSGKWDFMIQLYTKTIKDLDAVLLEISNKFLNLLKSYEIFIISDFKHLPQKYLTYDINLAIPKSLSYSSEFLQKKEESINIDNIDIKILKILEENSRKSLLDMSKEIGLSKDTIKYRIKKLIRQDIIKNFFIRLNHHKLGYQYYSILLKLKNIDVEKRKIIISYLENRKEVIAEFIQIGTWNLTAQVMVKNAIELKILMSELKEAFKDQIEDSDSVLYFNQYYFTYLPKIITEQKI